ncbi:MAG: hypothetical protein CM1200mP26_30330 [Acidimicrobiales bacterium]|nr:MAG: hypothetical protein CM1200mP26_30330 [Acidimicrobiales bacterium]
MLAHIPGPSRRDADDMVRRDATFTDLAVDPATLEDPSEVVNPLAAHPSPMQRPVAILWGTGR